MGAEVPAQSPRTPDETNNVPHSGAVLSARDGSRMAETRDPACGISRDSVHDSPALPWEGRASLFGPKEQFPLFIGYGRDFLIGDVRRQILRIVEGRRPALVFFDHAPMDALVDVLLGRIIAVLKVTMVDGDRR